MYIDNYRGFDEDQDSDQFDDLNQLYDLETYDLPQGCPYRQLVPPPPPFGGPGGHGGPGGPGSHGGMGGPSHHGAPQSPPPAITPQKSQATKIPQGGPGIKAVQPGTLKPCTYRYVYIWPRFGRGFWAFLTFVGRRSASGYRWNGNRWVYFGIDLRRIDSFICY